jgi:hypothetical protein
MNEALRHYIQNQDSGLEKTLRRMIGDELVSMTKQAA